MVLCGGETRHGLLFCEKEARNLIVPQFEHEQGRQAVLFEKRTQKLLFCSLRLRRAFPRAVRDSRTKSLLLLFFRKEGLAFLAIYQKFNLRHCKKTFVRLSRSSLTAAMVCLAGHLALAAPPVAAKSKASPFEVVPWSLAPVLGSAESRLNLRAERQDSDPAPGSETIIVFGKRMPRAPVESELVRHYDPGAEASQNEAAHSYVPGMGDTCTYKSGCFDKDQQGLFSSIPALFGSH